MSPINKYYPIEIEHVLIFVVLPTINNTNPIIVMGIPILYLDLYLFAVSKNIISRPQLVHKCLAYTYRGVIIWGVVWRY